MRYSAFIDPVGEGAIMVFEEFGRIWHLAWETIKEILRGKINFKLVMEQMVKIGVDSLPLALVTSAFVGMVFAIQIAGEFVRFGAGRYVGGIMGIGIARELAPAITGIVVAARVAASIAAEIGTMKVKDQIDAMYALGVSPIRYLVIPRFIAASLMLPLLTVMANFFAFFGGYLVATYLGKINPVQYMETAQYMVRVWDVIGGIAKTVLFGMIIAVIGSYKGLIARGGARGVGEATTSAVVSTLISLFIVNYFLSVLFFK